MRGLRQRDKQPGGVKVRTLRRDELDRVLNSLVPPEAILRKGIIRLEGENGLVWAIDTRNNAALWNSVDPTTSYGGCQCDGCVAAADRLGMTAGLTRSRCIHLWGHDLPGTKMQYAAAAKSISLALMAQTDPDSLDELAG